MVVSSDLDLIYFFTDESKRDNMLLLSTLVGILLLDAC